VSLKHSRPEVEHTVSFATRSQSLSVLSFTLKWLEYLYICGDVIGIRWRNSFSYRYNHEVLITVRRQSGSDTPHVIFQHGLSGLSVPIPQRHRWAHFRLCGEYKDI